MWKLFSSQLNLEHIKNFPTKFSKTWRLVYPQIYCFPDENLGPVAESNIYAKLLALVCHFSVSACIEGSTQYYVLSGITL